MATLADLRDAVSGWMHSSMPTAFYQTRITRTPGVVDPSINGFSASYDPTKVASEEVAKTNLDPTIQTLLIKEFGARRGFISSQPSATSKTMRHEQLHDIFEHGGVSEISNGLAPLVDTGIADYLRNSKTYQGEAYKEGWPRILADEGSAMDLTTKNPSESIKGLIADFLSRKGKTTELKQFKELTK